MKKLLTGLILVAVVVAVVGVGKNIVARAAVIGGVKAMTGLTLDVRSMDVGVLRSAIGIRGLALRNPSGFPDRYMIELPEIYVHYDLWGFLRGRVHLQEVRVNLKQFTVVKNAEGKVNLEALKVVKESEGAPKQAAAAPSKQPAPKIAIDLLELKVGKVVYKDYSKGGEPKVQEFAVNLDERHEHITNPQVLAGLIVSRALMKTTVAKLTGVDLGALQSQVQAQMQQAVAGAVDTAKALQTEATKQLGATTEGVSKAAAGVTEGARSTVEGATDAVKKTATDLKKVLPFGQ